MFVGDRKVDTSFETVDQLINPYLTSTREEATMVLLFGTNRPHPFQS